MAIEHYEEAELIVSKIKLLLNYMAALDWAVDYYKYPDCSISKTRLNYMEASEPNRNGRALYLSTFIPTLSTNQNWIVDNNYIVTSREKYIYTETENVLKYKTRSSVQEFDEAFDFQLSTAMNDLSLRNYYIYCMLHPLEMDVSVSCNISTVLLDKFIETFKQEHREVFEKFGKL